MQEKSQDKNNTVSIYFSSSMFMENLLVCTHVMVHSKASFMAYSLAMSNVYSNSLI